MKVAKNSLIRENMDKLPTSYSVLAIVARLPNEEVVARMEDGSLNQDTSQREAKEFGKGKHHREGDYARGIPGKGASSKKVPSVRLVDGDSAEVGLAKRIADAAIVLYECEQEAGRLKVDPAAGLDSLLDDFSSEQIQGLLAGLRYAIEFAAILERFIHDTSENDD